MSMKVMIQLAAVVLSGGSMLSVLLSNKSRKSRYWMVLAVVIFIYSLGCLFEFQAGSAEGLYQALRLQQLGTLFFAPLLYLFTRDYGDRPVCSSRTLFFLCLLPSVSLAAVYLYPACRLYFTDVSYIPGMGAQLKRGILKPLSSCYSFILLLAGIAEIVKYYPKTMLEDRVKIRIFLLTTLTSGAVLLSKRWYGDEGFLPAAVFPALIFFILNGYIRRHRIQDWFPFEQDKIVEQMNEGFIILDKNMRFVDANPVARDYFRDLEHIRLGSGMEGIRNFPLAILDPETSIQEFKLNVLGEDRMIRASKTDVCHKENSVCNCIVFHDITEIYWLMDELETKATQDALTALNNRENFFLLASRDFEFHIRTCAEAALMMIDLDHFKEVNDSYGHQSGDMVLKRVGSILQKRLRHTDICGRYGGEEFCVFLPATDLLKGFILAEDICKLMAEQIFPVKGADIRITVSIGVAELNPDSHKSIDDLIFDADQALYAAKESGRNRAVCSE